MRKVPINAPPAVTTTDKPGYVSEIRRYEVITPLYGGGEEPGKADSVTVVRATEIRGHLRFWWRATRGGMFSGSVKEMRNAEQEIWGSSGGKGEPGPSKVKVRITESSLGIPWKNAGTSTKNGKQVNVGDPGSPLGYAAFPLRSVKGSVLKAVKFSVKFEYPNDLGLDVEAALWAWETFGGIGARTRRGFGALSCTHVDGEPTTSPTKQDIKMQIQALQEKFIPAEASWPRGVPHLSRGLKYKIISSRVDTQQHLIDQLKQFRQDRNNGRFGRSKWPEPDEIRRRFPQLSFSRSPVHKTQKFPRAKFGLPIIFEFKQPRPPERPEPPKTTLQGHGYDRLASPLILRSLACKDGIVGLAAILEWEPLHPDDESYTPPGGLVLKGAPNDPEVDSDLSPEEAKHIPILQGNPNVLEAFLDFLK